jgi:hypothetical protein
MATDVLPAMCARLREELALTEVKSLDLINAACDVIGLEAEGSLVERARACLSALGVKDDFGASSSSSVAGCDGGEMKGAGAGPGDDGEVDGIGAAVARMRLLLEDKQQAVKRAAYENFALQLEVALAEAETATGGGAGGSKGRAASSTRTAVEPPPPSPPSPSSRPAGAPPSPPPSPGSKGRRANKTGGGSPKGSPPRGSKSNGRRRTGSGSGSGKTSSAALP